MEEVKSSHNSFNSRRTPAKPHQEPLKSTTPSLRCHFHADKLITNFCRGPACLLPLCPQCVPIHVSSHNTKGTSAQLETLEAIYDEARAILQSIQGDCLSVGGRVIELKSQFKRFPDNLECKIEAVKQRLFQEISNMLNNLTRRLVSESEEQLRIHLSSLDEIELTLRKSVASVEQSLQLLYTPNFMRMVIDTFAKKEAESHFSNMSSIENKLRDISNQLPDIGVDERTLLDTMNSELKRVVSLKCRGPLLPPENFSFENSNKEPAQTAPNDKVEKPQENTDGCKIDSLSNISVISEDNTKTTMNLSFNKLMGSRRPLRTPLLPFQQNIISGNPKIIEVKPRNASEKPDNILSVFENNENSLLLTSNINTAKKNFSLGTDSRKKPEMKADRATPAEPKCASVSPIRCEKMAPPVYDEEWAHFFQADQTKDSKNGAGAHQRSASISTASRIVSNQSRNQAQVQRSDYPDFSSNYFSFRPGFPSVQDQEKAMVANFSDSKKQRNESADFISNGDLKRDPYMLSDAPLLMSQVQNMTIDFEKITEKLPRPLSQENSFIEPTQPYQKHQPSDFGGFYQGTSKTMNATLKIENQNYACDTRAHQVFKQKEPQLKDKDILRERANEVLRNLHELSQGDIHIKRENLTALSGSKRKLIFSKEGVSLALAKKV